MTKPTRGVKIQPAPGGQNSAGVDNVECPPRFVVKLWLLHASRLVTAPEPASTPSVIICVGLIVDRRRCSPGPTVPVVSSVMGRRVCLRGRGDYR